MDLITNGNVKADSVLKATNGGPLGVTGLKRIVIRVVAPANDAKVWAGIPGVKKISDYSYTFNDGPAVMIEKAILIVLVGL